MKQKRRALYIVLGILAAVYFIAVLFYCILVRFGTMADGEAPGAFGYYFRSVTSNGGEEIRFSGNVIITKKLSVSETESLSKGDAVVYMSPGQSTVAGPLVIGTVEQIYSYDGGAMAYSIREIRSGKSGTIPALMVKERYTGYYLEGIAGFHDFFWSLTGFLVFVIVPVVLITGGIILFVILRRKKEANS